jgi:hypothetical protein
MWVLGIMRFQQTMWGCTFWIKDKFFFWSYLVLLRDCLQLRGLTRNLIFHSSGTDCIVSCYLFLCLTNCTASFGKGARWPHSCLNVLLNRFPFTLLTKASWLVKIHLDLIVLKFPWDMKPCHWIIYPSRQRNSFILEGRDILKNCKERTFKESFLLVRTDPRRIR